MNYSDLQKCNIVQNANSRLFHITHNLHQLDMYTYQKLYFNQIILLFFIL